MRSRYLNAITGQTPWPSQGQPDEPHDLAPRQFVPYTCDRGHEFKVTFAANVLAPAEWECRCGKPAGLGQQPDSGSELVRRMSQVRERRGDDDLERMIADRLAELRDAG